ncbi:hypothetical protein [Haloglomus irregulare]|uniref:hypothetical protein n=1 Tax=Haloglomus irregulare TaxID=2234134 RepID=UPI001186C7F8|nr:hypothetical protein [Haloglomus irregulare]
MSREDREPVHGPGVVEDGRAPQDPGPSVWNESCRPRISSESSKGSAVQTFTAAPPTPMRPPTATVTGVTAYRLP